MASIPLHCNICPKEPDFSDVSHLLTHVASKGHLSHFFKAQVRARHDDNVRHKVDVYDRWYNKYQIEKLLSRRMSAKQTRPEDIVKVPTKRQASTQAVKVYKPRGRHRIKKIETTGDEPSPVKLEQEQVLDPQLSTNALRPIVEDKDQMSSNHEAVSRRRAPVPHMHNWQFETPRRPMRSSSLPPYQRVTPNTHEAQDAINDTENDYLRSFSKSPTRTPYPDTPDLSFMPSKTSRTDAMTALEAPVIPSPMLKGVRYPGMSLFDAASLEEQRLRNQKKHGSIIEQMEMDSAAVVPMEHIYWPEGRLKKKRLITGNVESSPMKEPTPPPRQPRAKASRVFRDLSTNVPAAPKRRGRKTVSPRNNGGIRMEGMARRALQTIRSVYPRNVHMGYSPVEDPNHRTAIVSNHSKAPRNASFSVFRDPIEDDKLGSADMGQSSENPTISLPLKSSSEVQSPLVRRQFSQTRSHAIEQPATAVHVGPLDADHHLPAFSSPLRLYTDDDKENAPMLNVQAHMETDEITTLQPQRVTQRYFSTSGNQPPQFFNSMPPQMDFGGMAGHFYHGMFINPFNAFHHGNYHQPDFAPADCSQPCATVSTKQGPAKSVSFEQDA